MPKNIDEFNKICATIFTDLYEAFPKWQKINPHEFVAEPDYSGVDGTPENVSELGYRNFSEEEFTERASRLSNHLENVSIVKATIEFLESESLIRSKQIPSGFRAYCLTAKAFTHLSISFESGEIGRHTVASRIKKAIVERSTDALFACIPVAISGAVSS